MSPGTRLCFLPGVRDSSGVNCLPLVLCPVQAIEARSFTTGGIRLLNRETAPDLA